MYLQYFKADAAVINKFLKKYLASYVTLCIATDHSIAITLV